MDSTSHSPPGFRSITTAVTIVFALVVVVAMFLGASDIVLLSFLGLLFAVALTKASQWLGTKTSLSYGWSLGIIVTSIVVLTTGAVVLLVVRVESQVEAASQQLDRATARVREIVDEHPTLASLVKSVPYAGELLDDPTSLPAVEEDGNPAGLDERAAKVAEEDGDRAADSSSSADVPLGSAAAKAYSILRRAFGTTFGLLTNLFLVIFVSVFIASQPGLYKRGVVVLFPPARRERVDEVATQMGDALWNWLIGRAMTMTITGVGTGAALLFLGVPMAVTLGIATALLTFIPNFGAVISLLLAVMFALPQGVDTTLWVIGVYLLLQFVESNIITPVIQQRQVSVPPALLIAFQLLLGTLFGFLGVLVATPFLAVALVFIKRIYIEDYLGDVATESD